MVKHILFLLLILSFWGCSSEKARIRKSLKASLPAEQAGNYEFKSYTITETLLKENIDDSILNLQIDNRTQQTMIEYQMRVQEGYKSNLENCEHKKRTTLPSLHSSYNSLIKDWEEMIQESQEKIASDSAIIIANNKKISFFQEYINKTKSPIVFYKIHHVYKLLGVIKEEDILLDENYKNIKDE